ncbi:MAG: HEAT repeat domain-containing protein [bacterium]
MGEYSGVERTFSELARAGTKQAIEALMEGLMDEDPEVRMRACEALKGIGSYEANAALFRRLIIDKDERVGNRIRELFLDKPDMNLLLRALRDPEGLVREGAIEVLVEMDDRRVADALISRLFETREREVNRAKKALSRLVEDVIQGRRENISREDLLMSLAVSIGSTDERTFPTVVSLSYWIDRDLFWSVYLRSNDFAKGKMRELLKRRPADDNIIRLLLLGLRHSDLGVRDAALAALGAVATPENARLIIPAVDTLSDDRLKTSLGEIIDGIGAFKEYEEGLNDTDYVYRLECLRILAKFALEKHLPLFVNCLRDREEIVRKEALEALSKFQSEALIDPIVRMTEDESKAIRKLAFKTLMRYEVPKVVRFLTRHLNDLEGDMREDALRLIAKVSREAYKRSFDQMDEKTRKMVGSVIDKLDDSLIKDVSIDMTAMDPEARLRAIEMVDAIGRAEEVEPLLKQAIMDPDSRVRATVVKVLASIADTKTIRSLIDLLNDEDERVRANVIEALGGTGDVRFSNFFLPYLRDRDNRVRANAALALWRLGHPEVIETLKDMLADEDELMRASAVWALGEMRDRGILGALERIKETDSSYIVRDNAEKAIRKIRGGGAT